MNLRPLRPERNALAKLSYAPMRTLPHVRGEGGYAGDVPAVVNWFADTSALVCSGCYRSTESRWRKFIGAGVAKSLAGEQLDDIGIFGANSGQQALLEHGFLLHALGVAMLAIRQAADVGYFLGSDSQLAHEADQHRECEEDMHGNQERAHGDFRLRRIRWPGPGW